MNHPLARTDWIERASRGMARAGGAAILLCAVLISLDVLTRKLLGVAWFESYEVTIYVFAIAVAFGQAYSLVAGAHIRVDVLHAALPRPLRTALDALSLALLAGTTAYLAWHAWSTVAQSASLGARSNSTLGVPLVIPQGLWSIGLTWFALVAAVLLVRHAVLVTRGRTNAAEAILSGRALADNDAEHLIAPAPKDEAR